MISYKDMTFCTAMCGNHLCNRMMTVQVELDARKWWGSEDAPIAMADFSKECRDFMPLELESSNA